MLADGLTHVKDTAAVRLSRDGRRLYVSTRTQDVLSVINIEDPLHPSLLQCVSSGGQHPRDFILQDCWLIAANRFSNSIVSFALEDGLIGPETSCIEIPEAVALVMTRIYCQFIGITGFPPCAGRRPPPEEKSRWSAE